jgi:heme A synthase
MGVLLLALLSGLVLPLLVMVMKRHYESDPDSWEETLLLGAAGLAGVVLGVWIFTLSAFDEGSMGRILVSALAFWSIFIGGAIFLAAASSAKDLLEGTRGK